MNHREQSPIINRRTALSAATGLAISFSGSVDALAQGTKRQRIELASDGDGFVPIVEAVMNKAMKTEHRSALELAQVRMVELVFHLIDDNWTTKFSPAIFIDSITMLYKKKPVFLKAESCEAMKAIAIETESRKLKTKRTTADMTKKTDAYVRYVGAIVKNAMTTKITDNEFATNLVWAQVMINELASHILRDFPKNDASVFATAISRTSWMDQLAKFFEPWANGRDRQHNAMEVPRGYGFYYSPTESKTNYLKGLSHQPPFDSKG